jgi:hypothetical protein
LLKNLIKSHIDFEDQLLNIKNGRVAIAENDEPNIFANIAIAQRNEVSVELIAHGRGDGKVRGFSFDDVWSTDINSPNIIPEISPAKLKDFFKDYAFTNGQYKFSDLTLFCCNSYEFGRELATLMPEIKITCFKEYIRIDKDGKAYPYSIDSNTPKPIDRNGILFLQCNMIRSLTSVPTIFLRRCEYLKAVLKKLFMRVPRLYLIIYEWRVCPLIPGLSRFEEIHLTELNL